jgi:hypothetical protein
MRKPLISAMTTTGVTAAVIAVAIALTGCGDVSGTGSAESTNRGGAATPSSSPAGGSAPVSGLPGAADTAKRIEGTWAGLTAGKTVALSVKNGKAALVADEHVCQGSVEFMGEAMLAMTCADGSTDRVMGAIESTDGTHLVISWGATIKDSLTKTDAGKLPSSLPKL